MRAERAEYSMLKGSPVFPSLNSLIALVLSASLWADASGRRWRETCSPASRTFWNLEKNLDMVGRRRGVGWKTAGRKLIREGAGDRMNSGIVPTVCSVGSEDVDEIPSRLWSSSPWTAICYRLRFPETRNSVFGSISRSRAGSPSPSAGPVVAVS